MFGNIPQRYKTKHFHYSKLTKWYFKVLLFQGLKHIKNFASDHLHI